MSVRFSRSAPITNRASARRVRICSRIGRRQIHDLGKRAWAEAASGCRDQAQQTLARPTGKAKTQRVSPLSLASAGGELGETEPA
jgi:hypothetical protein